MGWVMSNERREIYVSNKSVFDERETGSFAPSYPTNYANPIYSAFPYDFSNYSNYPQYQNYSNLGGFVNQVNYGLNDYGFYDPAKLELATVRDNVRKHTQKSKVSGENRFLISGDSFSGYTEPLLGDEQLLGNEPTPKSSPIKRSLITDNSFRGYTGSLFEDVGELNDTLFTDERRGYLDKPLFSRKYNRFVDGPLLPDEFSSDDVSVDWTPETKSIPETPSSPVKAMIPSERTTSNITNSLPEEIDIEEQPMPKHGRDEDEGNDANDRDKKKRRIPGYEVRSLQPSERTYEERWCQEIKEGTKRGGRS
jgi:hypothetical protein